MKKLHQKLLVVASALVSLQAQAGIDDVYQVDEPATLPMVAAAIAIMWLISRKK